MKFKLSLLAIFTFVLSSLIFFGHSVLADTVTAISTATDTATAVLIDPNAPAFGPSLLGLISAIKVGAISAILLALGKVLQSDFVSGLVGGALSHTAVSWVNTVIAVVIATAATIAQPGVPWYIGVIEGIVSGLLSSGALSHLGAVPPAPPAS